MALKKGYCHCDSEISTRLAGIPDFPRLAYLTYAELFCESKPQMNVNNLSVRK
jgi:hypothetical protein